MAIDYPDILGEYVDAPKRFEVDGLQYVGSFEPKQINIGETSNLQLYLQNTLNAPLTIHIRSIVPQTGRIRTRPLLSLGASHIELTMAKAEVGLLTIPVTTAKDVVSGNHQLGVEIKVKHSKDAVTVRRSKAKDPLASLPFENRAGLKLVSVVGTSYSLKNGKKAKFPMSVSSTQADVQAETRSLEHSYQKLWTVEMVKHQHEAQREINKIRPQIINNLKIEPLFVALYVENKQRFSDVGLPLRPGEAIALAKLLTYTAHYFLKRGDLQDGLLCPIWERALINEFPTTDTIELFKVVGYSHILRLSIAFSFGMIAKVFGKQPWTEEERQGVMNYLIDTLDEGSPLEPDFLYLPLMMGALNVVRKVRLPDEDVAHTVQLIKAAKKARQDLFIDEEMKEADDIYTKLLKKATMKK
jgi:hypothetical protein